MPRRPLTSVPWGRHASLTAQTVAEHAVDDPLLLVLQGSRRLPAAVRTPAARLIGALGRGMATLAPARGAGSVVSAVSEHMLGRTPRALERLDGPAAGGLVGRADASVLLGDDAQAQRLLERVPEDRRGAPWHAVAARLALHRGDLDGAVAYAGRHRINRALRRRMAGERAAFTGHRPSLPAQPDYAPLPGRVLHVLTNSLPHTTSGYAQRSHSTLTALDAEGVQVRAVTRPGYPTVVGVPWARDEDRIGQIVYRRLLPHRLGQGTAARIDQHARLLAAEVERFRPEALHTTTHFVNAVAVRAVAEAYGIPWVYEVRGQLADTWASKRTASALSSQRYAAFVAAEAEAACSADAVVTLGATMARRLVEAGVSEDRITVCPNAVGEAFLDEPPARVHARARLGLDSEHVYVGTVSSIVGYEGLDDLLRAVALIAPRFPRLRVSIAGDGVSLPGLRALAEELGIAHLCRFPGRIARPEAVWEQASLDVFVVPRKDLPVTRAVTPMKSVEASAFARPVVASDLPALAELVEDGVTGRLAPAQDPRALAEVLAELVADPELRARLGEAGRAWALSTRTWAANARRYAQVYRELGVRLPRT